MSAPGVTRILEVPGAPGIFLIIAHTGKPDGVAVPLPAELQRPTAGGCGCPACTAHPDRVPMWDTLRAAEHFEGWVCHWPDLAATYGGILAAPAELHP